MATGILIELNFTTEAVSLANGLNSENKERLGERAIADFIAFFIAGEGEPITARPFLTASE